MFSFTSVTTTDIAVPIHTVHFKLNSFGGDETQCYSLIKLIFAFYFVHVLTVTRPFALQLSQISTLPSTAAFKPLDFQLPHSIGAFVT
jgi:hypothetical protein